MMEDAIAACISSIPVQSTLTQSANVAMKRLTVTNDMTSWRSSLIGKTLLRFVYVRNMFSLCSKVKRRSTAHSPMVSKQLMGNETDTGFKDR